MSGLRQGGGSAQRQTLGGSSSINGHVYNRGQRMDLIVGLN